MVALLEIIDIRKDLISIISNKERSSMPYRIFRIHTEDNRSKLLDLTIHAKTRLGAAIIFMDWCLNKSDVPNYWESFIDDFTDDESIQHRIEVIINEMFEVGTDNIIIEIMEPETLTLSI